LEPDPILRLKRIIGFGGSTFKDVSRSAFCQLSHFFNQSVVKTILRNTK